MADWAFDVHGNLIGSEPDEERYEDAISDEGHEQREDQDDAVREFEEELEREAEIRGWTCPLTLSPFITPCIATDGITYELLPICRYLEQEGWGGWAQRGPALSGAAW